MSKETQFLKENETHRSIAIANSPTHSQTTVESFAPPVFQLKRNEKVEFEEELVEQDNKYDTQENSKVIKEDEVFGQLKANSPFTLDFKREGSEAQLMVASQPTLLDKIIKLGKWLGNTILMPSLNIIKSAFNSINVILGSSRINEAITITQEKAIITQEEIIIQELREVEDDNHQNNLDVIQNSVGERGINDRNDTIIVQTLLSKIYIVQIDGICGNETIDTIKKFQTQFFNFTPDGLVEPGRNTWKKLVEIQSNDREEIEENTDQYNDQNEDTERPMEDRIEEVYGSPGDEHLQRFQLPFNLFFEGRPASSARLHYKVGDSLVNALSEVLSHYGLEQIKELRIDANYAGTYSYRKKRGGTAWSTHAYGVAIDLNSSENQLSWGSDRALFAKPEYEALLNIMEKHGWYNQGRYRGNDYMHFQAVKY